MPLRADRVLSKFPLFITSLLPYFRGAPSITRVRFRVVPDAVVRALELRKGSADLEMSSLSPDIIPVLARQPGLEITDRSGTNLTYLGFNLEDPLLSRRELRQALAFATDREALIRYLLRGQAKVAAGGAAAGSLGGGGKRRAVSL